MTVEEKASELKQSFGKYRGMDVCDEFIKEYHGYRVKPYLSLEHAKELSVYWQEVRDKIEEM